MLFSAHSLTPGVAAAAIACTLDRVLAARAKRNSGASIVSSSSVSEVEASAAASASTAVAVAVVPEAEALRFVVGTETVERACSVLSKGGFAVSVATCEDPQYQGCCTINAHSMNQ